MQVVLHVNLYTIDTTVTYTTSGMYTHNMCYYTPVYVVYVCLPPVYGHLVRYMQCTHLP